MASYIVGPGDSFESIATTQYGDPTQASLIRSANSGAALTPGTVLNIPLLPAVTPPPANVAPTQDPTEVTLSIGGQDFRGWEQVTITRGVDSVSTMEFTCPRSSSPEFRALFRPLSFVSLIVKVGGRPFFTGTALEFRPEAAANSPDRVVVTGYSRPGVLDDCTAPSAAYPIEWKGLTLVQVATAIASPFGVAVAQDEGVTPGSLAGALERVKLQPDRPALDLIVALAKQKKALVASTTNGELLLRTPPVVGAPVLTWAQGDAGPVTGLVLQTAPQQYYSEVTGVRRVGRNSLGGKHTVLNPSLHRLGVLRPLTRHVEDISDGGLPASTEALAGRMLAESVTVTVDVGTWLDAAGAVWEPATTVSLQSDSAFIYSAYDFLIREVRYVRKNGGETTAQLLCVLPGAFSGEIPDVLPWD
jgi:prophage tail gpP-like protein